MKNLARTYYYCIYVQTVESLVITDIHKEVDAMDIKSNYSKIPNVAFELGLNCKQLAVFLYLCRCANNGQAYPTYDTIAQKTGMSSRTVKRIIPQLEEMGIIKKNNRSNSSNLYDIILPKN